MVSVISVDSLHYAIWLKAYTWAVSDSLTVMEERSRTNSTATSTLTTLSLTVQTYRSLSPARSSACCWLVFSSRVTTSRWDECHAPTLSPTAGVTYFSSCAENCHTVFYAVFSWSLLCCLTHVCYTSMFVTTSTKLVSAKAFAMHSILQIFCDTAVPLPNLM